MVHSLAEAYKATPPRPPALTSRPKNLTTEIEVKEGGDVVEATVNLSVDDPTEPEGFARELLTKKGLDPALYEVTGFRSSTWTMMDGSEGESNRFTFALKGTAAASSGKTVLPDLDDLHALVQREMAARPRPSKKVHEDTSVICIIADTQIGKTDVRGGTEELLRRLEASRERFAEYVKRVKPKEVILLDAGDSIENFESTASEDRTNDLQLTEMIRVWRRVFWSWITTAAKLAPTVSVMSVGSNHCRVRRGKNNMGTPSDDYGIETLSQLADMAAVHPKKYGHVSFFAPGKYEESVAYETCGGLVIGLAHGHQVRNPNALEAWLNGQAAGRTPIGHADIAFFGHFHHLRMAPFGDGRVYWICPTSDAGSSWFKNISGHDSDPGVLVMTVDPDGWRNLDVC